jgi:DNA transposition AAA+ family ATPase
MSTSNTNNPLPTGQEPILTSNITRFSVQADLQRNSSSASATVGIVVGAPGTGKTTAAYLYLAYGNQQQQSPPTRCVLVNVMPQSTTKALLYSITHRISDCQQTHTSHEAFQQALLALEQGRTQLLMLDNGDYLRREHLEILRALAEQTTCSIMLIGLPRLLAYMKTHPPFAARVGPILRFRPLPDEEVFTTFLPQLNLPGWAFDPENEAHHPLGEYLWKNARPSLRRLHMILSYANQLAQMRGQATITHETIRLAVHMMTPSDYPCRSQSEEEE